MSTMPAHLQVLAGSWQERLLLARWRMEELERRAYELECERHALLEEQELARHALRDLHARTSPAP